MTKSRGAYRILVEKTEGMRPLGRTSVDGEKNIKMDFQKL